MSRRTCLFALLGPLACGPGQAPSQTAPAPAKAEPEVAAKATAPEPAAPAQATGPTTYPCSGFNTLSFGPTVPPDFSQVSSDQDADCYGWQEFIAVNWPASGDGFGDPGDMSAVAWQGYMSTHQLFQPKGAPPPPWGTPPAITPECLAEAGLSAEAGRAAVPLTMTTKFSSEFENGDGQQAAPRNAPAWLGDTQGHSVWYEVRVDQDEYDAIVQNQLYSREGQQAYYAENPTQPLALPMGGFPSTVGAMEVKAAWMEVANPADAKWSRYKVSQAVVVDPATQKCESLVVALVGLHVIHKTQGQPTWVWATFEHVDNAPDNSAAATTDKVWNFFDPGCQPKTVTVPSACQFNKQAQVTVGCDASAWNQAPQYYIGDGCPDPTPIQVTRINPIDVNATAANNAAWAAIRAAYPNSVWQNYALVNVLWSTNPPLSQPVAVPQKFLSPQPNAPVANTALETYAQQTKCTDCHTFAAISGDDTKPADFSFALEEAQSTQTTKVLAGVKGRARARRIIQ